MKVTVFLSVLLLCCLLDTNCLIIPDELPSLLSVIYSNIPVLKKGTDSRIGWGFRLGNRADFQVMVELGPQIYTQPLQNQQKTEANKRNTLESLADTLYAQNKELKKLKAQIQNEEQSSTSQKIKEQKMSVNKNNAPEAANWLRTWSASIEKPSSNYETKPKPGLGIGEIDAKSVIPEDEEDKIENSNAHVSTTPSEDALDNVDLD